MDLNKLLNELHLERRRIEEMIRSLESLASSRPAKPGRLPAQRKSGAAKKIPREEKRVSSIDSQT